MSAAAVAPAAVIFDNDGLLLETESVWTRADQILFARRGLEFTPEHKLELVGTPAHTAAARLERMLGEPGRAVKILAERDLLVLEELNKGVEPMPGAVELVNELRAAGTPLGLVSNSPRIFVDRSLELTGLGDRFDEVLSAHEVAAPKPAPDPYIEICARLGVKAADAVALEDSPTGVESALAAGLTVVGVPSVPGVELEGCHVLAGSLTDAAARAAVGLT